MAKQKLLKVHKYLVNDTITLTHKKSDTKPNDPFCILMHFLMYVLVEEICPRCSYPEVNSFVTTEERK